MPVIKFACPHCSHQLTLPIEFQGKEGECPSCQRKVQVNGLVVGEERAVKGPLSAPTGQAPPPLNVTPISPPPPINEFKDRTVQGVPGAPPSNRLFCRNCGTVMSNNASTCRSCGVPAGYGNRFCPHCKAQTHESATKCGACGAELGKQKHGNASQNSETLIGTKSLEQAVAGIAGSNQEYYRAEFQSIQDAGGGFRASFNLAAFLFGPIWYIYHGMWKKALILIGASILTFAVATPLIWAYSGLASNYDLYLFKVRGKELW